jgi:type II secretory pathway component PulF
MTRQWSALLSAGVPLRSALSLLAASTPDPAMQRVVGDVLTQVEAGSSVATALGAHPRVFSNPYVGLVTAGEAGGDLDRVLSRVARDLDRHRGLRRKVWGALLYPAVVLVSALAATALLLFLVVPTFSSLYESADVRLPLPTQVVMALAHAVQSGWRALGVAVGVGGGALVLAIRTEEGRRLRDQTLLRLPLFGALFKGWIMARFTRTLGALLASGVGILEALGLTRAALGNQVVEGAVSSALAAVRSGEPLALGLTRSGQFTPLVVHMVQTGEETGRLSDMLEGLATLLEDETEASVQRVLSLLEPLLILGVGILVGGLIVALYLPILDLAGTIG